MLNRWETATFADQEVLLLNLESTSVQQRVIQDMQQGMKVYYDTRWSITAVLAEWLAEHPDLYAGKRVLVLGAGVGEESVILGQRAEQLWVNDLSSVALELCQEQLRENGVDSAITLPGDYSEIELPEVDLIVGSFLVYNPATLSAMREFVCGSLADFLLVNERLSLFMRFLEKERHEVCFERDDALAVYFRR